MEFTTRPTVRGSETELSLAFAFRVASMQAAGLIPSQEAWMGKVYSTELSQRIQRNIIATRGLGLPRG